MVSCILSVIKFLTHPNIHLFGDFAGLTFVFCIPTVGGRCRTYGMFDLFALSYGSVILGETDQSLVMPLRHGGSSNVIASLFMYIAVYTAASEMTCCWLLTLL